MWIGCKEDTKRIEDITEARVADRIADTKSVLSVFLFIAQPTPFHQQSHERPHAASSAHASGVIRVTCPKASQTDCSACVPLHHEVRAPFSSVAQPVAQAQKVDTPIKTLLPLCQRSNTVSLANVPEV